ncbi:MAG: hypothetical protein MUE85_12225 [Microscillaceae bacterium]|jgi:hypothetical protein|nr:hypothetical protein [Microscillaceae bacterium]
MEANVSNFAENNNNSAENLTEKPEKTGNSNETLKANNAKDNKFYQLIFSRKTGKNEIEINPYKLALLLKSFGFHRYDLQNGEDFIFIQITKNIVKEVSRNQIIDFFFKWLDKNHSDDKLSLSRLKEKLYKGLATYFSKDILARLVIEKPLYFLNDTQTEAFFYFLNGVVKVTAESLDFQDYNTLQGCIWERQIIARNFTFQDNYNESVFSKFCFFVSKEDLAKYQSLCTLIGYLLHDYKGGKRKAINFTDGSLDTKNNGRSGKTLLCKAIGKLRVYTEVNGKDFKPEDKHKYQLCNLDTQFVNLNDVKKTFTLESVYNDITEAIKVEGKNKKPFDVISKIAICSNRPLRTEGGSDKDRIVEFEFSDFFSEKHQPKDYFGHWFFAEWSEKQWNEFDSFMLSCVQHYLKFGIIEPINENLNRRKILEHTDEDFITFIESGEIKSNFKYDKKKLYEDFKNTFGREDVKQKRFTIWLQTYSELCEQFAGFTEGIERNAGYLAFIIFHAKTEIDNNLIIK